MKQTHFPHNPELNRALLAVSDLMAARIKTKDGQLESALQKMATNGGKFLRPAFFWLFASLTGQPQPEQRDRLIKLATSIEVLHMATLIHDDIIDDSPERRGRISIQAEFGKDVAVYSGDYLFTIFFDLITTTTATTPFLTTNAQIMHRILRGELGQMADRFKQDQTFLSYLRNINGKTAALFSLAASEGAYFGGADQRTVALAKRIGQNVGIAFQ
ncbi:MAG: polyprenyl synthetase family protein, partial [Limosilactobacillus fermentum]